METTDRELLQAFLRNKSEAAFRQLVDRHLPMVLGTARRMLRNEPSAQEVAQNTFAVLAHKGATLTGDQSLGGWLHRAARNECLHVQRAEGRRRQREETAVAMNAIEQAGHPPELLGDLEEALEELAPEEHDAVVLRYLEDRKLHEVGTELGVSEDAARMRVNRALDRLRMIFEKRGVTITAGTLTAVLLGESTMAAPAGLVAVIVTAALAKSATATGVAGAGTVAGWFTLKSAAVVTGVVATTAAGLVWVHQSRQADTPTTATSKATVATNSQVGSNPATGTVGAGTSSTASSTDPSNAGSGLPSGPGSEQPPTPEASRLVEEARGLIERKQFEDALQRIDAALDLSPRFADAFLFRGNAHEGMEKLQDALADHKRAAELRPNFKQAWFEQSRIYDRLQQYDQAIRTATRTIEIDPEFWQAWLGRGRAKYYLSLNRDALPDLDRAAELNPRFPDIYNYRALVQMRLYDFEEAIKNRRLAAKVAPDDFVQHYRLAYALWQLGQPEEALKACDRAIELSPGSPGGWRVRSWALANLGRDKEALADLDELVHIEPQNHNTFRQRGLLYLKFGPIEKALDDLNRAVQLGSGYGPNYLGRARVYLALNKPDEALPDLQRAEELGRNRRIGAGGVNLPDLWEWRGEAFLQQTNGAAAIQEFSRVIIRRTATQTGPRQQGAYLDRLDGAPPEDNGDDERLNRKIDDQTADPWLDRPFLKRGYAYLIAGQPANALTDLDYWIKRHGDNAQGYFYRGQVQMALEKQDAAMADFSRAIELNKNFIGAWEFRGAVHYRNEDYQLALDDFLAALKLSDQSEYAARMGGWSAFKLGRLPQTIDLLSQSLKLNPTNAVVYENRGSAYAQLEQWSRAFADYTSAAQYEPRAGRLQFYRANFQICLGDLDTAMSIAEVALGCDDLDPQQRQYLIILTALGKPSDNTTRQRLKSAALPANGGWPSPIIQFLRGDINYADALKSTGNAAERDELHTYAGWHELNTGRTNDGRAHLRKMIQEGDRKLFEYHLARLLLKPTETAANSEATP